jgi:FkbM family methyltransferase
MPNFPYYAQSHALHLRYPKMILAGDGEFLTGEYGERTRRSFFSADMTATIDTLHRSGGIGEPFFETLDILEAIDDAHDRFVMADLGAGYGRWLAKAALILRRYRPMPHVLIGVEAEKSHFDMMRQHFLDNDLAPEHHRLVQAAVSARPGDVYFTEGHGPEWWGQSVLSGPDDRFGDWPEARVVRVPGLTIESILEGIDRVDLLDADIQGAELTVFAAARETVNRLVKRVHVGTHSHQIDIGLFELFTDMGWICTRCYPCQTLVQTEFGPVEFEDGIQSWVNPALHTARAG